MPSKTTEDQYNIQCSKNTMCYSDHIGTEVTWRLSETVFTPTFTFLFPYWGIPRTTPNWNASTTATTSTHLYRKFDKSICYRKLVTVIAVLWTRLYQNMARGMLMLQFTCIYNIDRLAYWTVSNNRTNNSTFKKCENEKCMNNWQPLLYMYIVTNIIQTKEWQPSSKARTKWNAASYPCLTYQLYPRDLYQACLW